MTKKDYRLMAEVIKKHFETYLDYYTEGNKNWHLSELVKSLAERLKNENERFDYVKFLSACGIEE